MVLGLKIILALIVAGIFLKLLKKVVHAVILGAVAYFILQYFM